MGIGETTSGSVLYWSPYLGKIVNSLETVLKRFTGVIPEKGRLDKPDMYPLKFRREKQDLIETCKTLRGG